MADCKCRKIDKPEETKSLYDKFELPFVAVFVATILWLAYLLFGVMIGDYPDNYSDTDPYIRALRVENLMATLNWAEAVSTYSNYPFGEILHWTRPLDVIWAGLAYLFLPFYDLKSAVFNSGWFLSPLLNIVSCMVLVWGLRTYASAYLRLIAVLLFLLQISLSSIYSFPRPDHHSLLSLCVVMSLAFYLVYESKHNLRNLVFMGASFGMMIWVAGEGFIYSYIMLASLGIMWLVKKIQLREMFTVAAGMFAVVLLGWIVNPPAQGYWFPQNDRISALTVLITGLTLFSFGLMLKLEEKGLMSAFKNKVFYGTSLTILSVLIVFVTFGIEAVLGSPVDSSIQLIWQQRVLEMKPIEPFSVHFFAYVATPLVAIIISVIVLLLKLCDNTQSRIILFLLLPLTVYAALTFWAMRFSVYGAAISVFSVIIILSAWVRKASINDKLIMRFGHKKKCLLGAAVIFFMMLYAAFLTFFMYTSGKSMMMSNTEENLGYMYLIGGKGAVLADVFAGPLVVYRTGRPVVATPYHHNVQGIRDTHDMFFSSEDEEARELFLKHQIGTVFLTSHILEEYYDQSFPTRLYYRLIDKKNYPCWLTLDTQATSDKHILYQVDEEKIKEGCLF